ncbi:unnamed protein product [Heligmosomoides polygyrus]|uniref:Uncharacterized protein n=1 Tax=Heligmosomoides polygyrus TaxID=6339 RepID=A0A183F6N9_HELPZ|nr:unnamed protein product [Heligmosomoides polygyrus]
MASSIPPPVTPIVRSLCESVRQKADIIAGMAATVGVSILVVLYFSTSLSDGPLWIDSLINLYLAQDAALRKTNSYVVTASRRTLPGDRRFTVENLSKACDPESEIQGFACRFTGKHGKDHGLKDWPEDIVAFVTDFLIDALGLSDPDDIDMHEQDLIARRNLCASMSLRQPLKCSTLALILITAQVLNYTRH